MKSLGYIQDRSNITNNYDHKGSELPEFTDVKMFVDSLLMGYQTNRQIQFELERNLMTCTPFRADYLFSKINKTYSPLHNPLFFIFSICIKFYQHGYAIHRCYISYSVRKKNKS